MSDHYQTLGVDRDATPEQIKKAYRKLAGKHHPDKGGDTAMFQKIEEAYRVLSDPSQKQQYDNPNPFMNSSQPHGFHFNFNNGMFNFDDLFGQMFQQHAHQHRPRQQVYRTQIYITLEQAYQGGMQSIRIQTPQDTHMVNIQIPKGVNSGGQMRYDNLIPNAQLLVEFRVHPHLKFDRRDNDLYCPQQISVLDLIVGTTIKFTTISGKEFEVKIQPNTQPNTNLRIPAQGMPIPGTNSYGDQIILIKPFIPDRIDSEITDAILRSKNKQP